MPAVLSPSIAARAAQTLENVVEGRVGSRGINVGRPVVSAPGVAGRAVYGVSGVLGGVQSKLMMASMAVGVLNMLSRLPLIGGPLGGLATIINTPVEAMNTSNVGDVKNILSGTVGKVEGWRVQTANAKAQKANGSALGYLQKAIKKLPKEAQARTILEKIEQRATATGQLTPQLAARASRVLNADIEGLGASAKAAVQKTAGKLTAAAQRGDGYFATAKTMNERPAGRLKAVQNAIAGKENAVGGVVFKGAQHVSTALGTIAEKAASFGKIGELRDWHVKNLRGKSNAAYEAAKTSLDTAVNSLSDPKLDKPRRVLAAVQKRLADGKKLTPDMADRVTRAVGRSIKNLDDAGRQAVEEAAGKSIGEFAKKTLTSHKYFKKAQFRGDFKAGIEEIPSQVAQTNVMSAVYKGVYYTSQAVTAYQTVKIFTSGLDTLKHMYAGATGTDIKKVSTFKMLFGKMPDCMKGARKQLLFSAVPQALANIVGMGTYHFMNRGGGGMKTMAIGAGINYGVGMIGQGFSGQNNLVSVYRKVAEVQATGAEVPMGAYLGLLLHASDVAAQKGPENTQLIMAARYYAEQRMTAEHIMFEVNNGTFEKRLASMVPASAPVGTPAPDATHHQAPIGQWQARRLAELAASRNTTRFQG